MPTISTCDPSLVDAITQAIGGRLGRLHLGDVDGLRTCPICQRGHRALVQPTATVTIILDDIERRHAAEVA